MRVPFPRQHYHSDHATTWAGMAVVVLSAGVAIALPAALIIIALSPAHANAELVAVLSTLAGAAVGAIGTWLGSIRQDRYRSEVDADAPPESTRQ